MDYNITIVRTPTPQPTATVCRPEVRVFFFCVNRKSPDQSRVVSEKFEKKNAVKPVRTVKRTYSLIHVFGSSKRTKGQRGTGRLPGGTVSAKAPYSPASRSRRFKSYDKLSRTTRILQIRVMRLSHYNSSNLRLRIHFI